MYLSVSAIKRKCVLVSYIYAKTKPLKCIRYTNILPNTCKNTPRFWINFQDPLTCIYVAELESSFTIAHSIQFLFNVQSFR